MKEDEKNRSDLLRPDGKILFEFDGLEVREDSLLMTYYSPWVHLSFSEVYGYRIARQFNYDHPIVASIFSLALIAGGVLGLPGFMDFARGQLVQWSGRLLPTAQFLGPLLILFGAVFLYSSLGRSDHIVFKAEQNEYRFSLSTLAGEGRVKELTSYLKGRGLRRIA